MKKALLKDTICEIKNSFGRFVSILAIVALGCGFFAGIKVTMPDMKDTATSYFSDNNLYDLDLKSSIGVKSEDVDAVKETDGVKGAAAGYSKDVYYSYEGQNLVLRAISYKDENVPDCDDLNQLILVEGRLPESSGECVVEQKISSPDSFKVGETLTLTEPDSGADLSDSLKNSEYTIVGIAYSPAYIGYERDKTTVGNGSVDSNIFIPESEFTLSYYTDLYVTFDSTADLEPFSDEYKDEVESCAEAVNEAFTQSVNSRYEELKSDTEAEIAEATASADSYEEFLNYDANTLSALALSLESEIAELSAKEDKTVDEQTSLTEKTELLQKTNMRLTALSENDTVTLNEMQNDLTTARLSIEQSTQQLNAMSEPTIYQYDRFDSNDYSSYSEDSERVDNVAKVFPVFFIIVAALVCLTTMTRMIDEKRTEIGTYKALGYKEWQIAAKYLIYASLASVIGCTVGVWIGLKTLPVIIFNAYKMLYNIASIDTPFRWDYYLLCLLCSLAVTAFAVLGSLHRELKAQPSEIMRPKAPPIGKRVLLERIPILWNRLGFLSKVTVRNLFRYKKRFLMTLFGVAGCTALIMAGFGVKYSVSAIADKQFEDVLVYDGTVNSDTSRLSDFDSLKSSLSEYDEISESFACSFSSFNAEANDSTQSVYVISSSEFDNLNEFIRLRSAKGNKQLSVSDDGVIITEKLSKLLDLSVGDSIKITRDTESAELKITGIAKNYAMHYLFISPSLYEESFGEEIQYNCALINLTEDADSTSLSEEIIASGDYIGISYITDSGKSFKESMSSMDAIVWVLIICAGGLAIIVLYNLANINITERVREIATIKVLGFYDGEVASYIYRENIISTVIGIIIGFGVGVILHKFVIHAAEVDLVMFERNLAWWAYVLAAVLTLVFAALVNFVLYFKLSRVKMVESLKSVE